MSSTYQQLSHHKLEEGSTYSRPPQLLPENVTAESAAIDVMTDFTKVAAITMGPCGTMDDAEKRMIASGVRLLLVVDHHNHVMGLVTLVDLHGERPVKYMQETGTKREDVFLRDIMTPRAKLEVLHMPEVEKSRVGDIIETMKESGRQHALVVDGDAVRGLFSTKTIANQLGLDYKAKDQREIFSMLEALLS